jgi:hypothetical protein
MDRAVEEFGFEAKLAGGFAQMVGRFDYRAIAGAARADEELEHGLSDLRAFARIDMTCARTEPGYHFGQ